MKTVNEILEYLSQFEKDEQEDILETAQTHLEPLYYRGQITKGEWNQQTERIRKVKKELDID